MAYFRKVVELRSFSNAATALHMTQPALSRQIKLLERDVNHILFDRTTRGVEPTAAARALYRHLEGVFAQLERIPEIVRTGSKEQELIRVGIPRGLPPAWGEGLLRLLEERAPQTFLSLHEGTTEEQRHLLQTGGLEVGLIHMDAPELRCELLLVQQMGVSVPPESPLSGLQEVTLRQLDGLRVMAHAVGEIEIDETRFRAAALAAEADVEWLFRRFSEHSALIARASRAEAVLSTRISAARQFSDWIWMPLAVDTDEGIGLDIGTWAAVLPPVTPAVRSLVALMAEHSQGLLEPSR